MKHLIHRSLIFRLLVLALLVTLSACNLNAAVTPTAVISNGITSQPTTFSIVQSTDTPVGAVAVNTPTTAQIVHTLKPGDPPASSESNITDRDSSVYATQKRANGGENYSINLYERPFNANTMDTYFPDLDIKTASLARDSQWVYINIKLVGQNQSGGLLGDYGVELDLNIDGRGDVLVMASKPGKTWSTDGVRVWLDKNHDVGSAHPLQSDAPSHGDGYESLIFDNGTGTDPDTAWACTSPNDENSVQIAFKRSVINDDGKFTWGAWAMDDSVFNAAQFDYNDYFTQDQAGSPLVELTKYYPIKGLAELDNTCRWSAGFTPSGNEPGICPVPPTPTPILPGSISGIVFRQINGDLIYHPGNTLVSGANIRVRSGDCGSPGGVVATTTTNTAGKYSVNVSVGTYCVDVSPSPDPTANRETGPLTVTITSGLNAVANFGYSEYLGMR